MSKLIDLTHPLQHGMPVFPGDPLVDIKSHNTISQDEYNLSSITMGSHQGTHLDAPNHYFDDGKTIEKMALEQFFGKATCIDLAPDSVLAPRTILTIEMFEPHAHHFLSDAKIIYRTGWSHAFGTSQYFEDYPTLSLEAAQWMADKKIGLLGMDTPTPSIDATACHHILLQKGVEIVIVESLTNLHLLPMQFIFSAFPLNLQGVDGSPLRAIAIIED